MAQSQQPRLLIVDDEVANVDALCDVLSHQGYTTAGFTDGELALDALRHGRFELLLADLMMPRIDGIALLQAALLIDPMLVGIIMTGEGTITSAVAAMQSGAIDYILKPFNLKAILPVLVRGLTLRHLRVENLALERQLRERAIALEAANRELDAYTRTVSHDLRAPLRAIDGFSQMLAEDCAEDLSGTGREYLDTIRDAARRMRELIDDLLRLSRVSSSDLNRTLVDISNLAWAVGNELQRNEPERIVRLIIQAGLVADVDERLLRIVLENLFGNAWKFTLKTSAPEVTLSMEQRDGEDIFLVRDNGAGFDMRHAGKLFQPFQRLHPSNEFPGTGIGLATVRRVIERHSGRVWAQGAPGQGASIYFTIPPAAKIEQ